MTFRLRLLTSVHFSMLRKSLVLVFYLFVFLSDNIIFRPSLCPYYLIIHLHDIYNANRYQRPEPVGRDVRKSICKLDS